MLQVAVHENASVQLGNELTIDYGARDAWKFLRRFGFLPRNMSNTEASVELWSSFDDALQWYAESSLPMFECGSSVEQRKKAIEAYSALLTLHCRSYTSKCTTASMQWVVLVS